MKKLGNEFKHELDLLYKYQNYFSKRSFLPRSLLRNLPVSINF
jgi:hypothetical protein